MATIQERLADSLMELQKLQNDNGLAVIQSSDLSRVHLERLVTNGFLQEVMKGRMGATDFTSIQMNTQAIITVMKNGKGFMPSYQGVLGGSEMDAVSEYVLNLSKRR